MSASADEEDYESEPEPEPGPGPEPGPEQVRGGRRSLQREGRGGGRAGPAAGPGTMWGRQRAQLGPARRERRRHRGPGRVRGPRVGAGPAGQGRAAPGAGGAGGPAAVVGCGSGFVAGFLGVVRDFGLRCRDPAPRSGPGPWAGSWPGMGGVERRVRAKMERELLLLLVRFVFRRFFFPFEGRRRNFLDLWSNL